MADSNYVYRVDSIRIGKTYRRQFLIVSKMDTSYAYDSIIEGIGSAMGLLEKMKMPFETGSFLTCFTQNSKTLYPDTTTSCQFFYLGVNNINKRQTAIDIYPNPANNEVNINYKIAANKAVLNLYSPLGQLVRSQTISNNAGTVTEDVSALPDGIYYYQLVVDGVAAASKLAVVH